jgi:hypothetical protein
LVAAPWVIHPPQENPITIAATAPPTAPQIAGLVDFGMFIVIHLFRYISSSTKLPTTVRIPRSEMYFDVCPIG